MPDHKRQAHKRPLATYGLHCSPAFSEFGKYRMLEFTYSYIHRTYSY